MKVFSFTTGLKLQFYYCFQSADAPELSLRFYEVNGDISKAEVLKL